MSEEKIKYFDMFAGIGGFRTGLAHAGDLFLPVGWCEIDPFCQKAYRALYRTGGEYFNSDATRIDTDELPEIDLICGGFPCQPFSVSGKRRGFDDTRGTLFHEIVRVAEARMPQYLLLENVPGLLNHDGGKTFGTIIRTIHELGYSLEWCVLNSANFGVPHQRRRVYIVGYLDQRLSGKIFPLKASDGTNLKQIIPGGQGQRVYATDGTSTCLTSQGGGWGAKTGLYFIDMNADPKVTHEARCITARQNAGVSNHKGEHSGVIGARAVITPERETVRQQGRRIKEPDEPNQLTYIKDAGREEADGFSFWFKHTKEWQGNLPDSMTDAMYAFYVVNAIRDLRGDHKDHRSMLINISRFVAVQKYIKTQVEDIHRNAYRAIKFNITGKDALKDPVIRRIYEIYEKYYSFVEFSWDQIAAKMFDSIENIQIKVVNSSKSSEKLEYPKNDSLRVIAIGGLALSRGLTLEGLVISYFYRNTSTYDVLMQMGRWFGYRKNYDDLFRIWTHKDSADW